MKACSTNTANAQGEGEEEGEVAGENSSPGGFTGVSVPRSAGGLFFGGEGFCHVFGLPRVGQDTNYLWHTDDDHRVTTKTSTQGFSLKYAGPLETQTDWDAYEEEFHWLDQDAYGYERTKR